MAQWSFLQSTFLGGIWSQQSQGNMHAPAYKTALNVSSNCYPVEEGTWLRRQGTRFLGPTRGGNKGRVIAFDFNVIQPYQMEFTDGYLRLYAGLTLVTTNAGIPIDTISADNPAVVTTRAAHGFSTGNTVILNIQGVPCSAPILCNRQFTITVIDSLSFTLADSVTGTAIDGTNLGYVYRATGNPDMVQAVFELATPYTNGDWANLRTLSNATSVILLHPKYAPRILYKPTPTSLFALATAAFLDGPYLDINATATTLTPSGTSGAITLVASAVTGINNGAGFVSTDVGRLIRIQGGPPVWAIGTTYATGAVVTGADSNTYQSLTSTNVGNDPTTDGGVNWQLGTTGVTWTWGVITAVNSTTNVSFTINGAKLVNTNATPVWRIGTFSNTSSDTSGWPSSGCFHEGRLWLTGAVANRVDAGTSNNVNTVTNGAVAVNSFNFEPTGTDGTVADDNAIAATANATEVNAIFWMAPDPEGIILGTQAGEWIIQASQLVDPLTPTTIQMRRFSTYGCANIEPVRASREIIFVQRQQRKLLELGKYPYGEVAGYYAPNMAKFAENLTVGGIEEIRWQQEQVPIVWARRSDGQLVAATYKHAPASGMGTADTFTAWHGPHALGSGRIVESISTGPSYDGLSETLYLVSAPANGTGTRFVEVLTPLFDDALQDWQSFFVDGGGAPCCGTGSIDGSGNPTGVKFYGLWYSVGYSVSVVLGGLDLGDYVVAADGSVTLTFGTPAAFTAAFYTGLNGSGYSVYAATASFPPAPAAPTPPPVAINNLICYADVTDADETYYESDLVHLDSPNAKAYMVTPGTIAISSGTNAGIRRFNTTTGDEDLHHNISDVFASFYPAWAIGTTYAVYDVVTGSDGNVYVSAGSGNTGNDPTTDAVHWNNFNIVATTRLLGRDGFLYMNVGGGNTCVMAKVNASTLVATSIFGHGGSGTGPSTSGGLVASFGMCSGAWYTGSTLNHYLASVGLYDSSHVNEVAFIDTVANTFISASQITEAKASICTGAIGTNYGTIHGLGYAKTGHTTSLGVYTWMLPSPTRRKGGVLTPAQIDATWTNIDFVRGPAFDQTDGNIILMVGTNDSVTNKGYILKVRPADASIVWQTILPGGATMPVSNDEFCQTQIPRSRFCWLNGHTIYEVNTITGAIPTYAWNTGISISDGQQWDDASSSITFFGSWNTGGTGPTITYLGAYLPAHSDAFTAKWGRLYLGQLHSVAPFPITSGQYTSYTTPTTIGFTYTSQGQLLRPDFGDDAGTRMGPAFGKKRRIHSASFGLYRTQGMSVGTDFTHLVPLRLTGVDETTVVSPPTLYSGICWQTLDASYDFTNQICWQVSRPYPAMIQAIEGYLSSADK